MLRNTSILLLALNSPLTAASFSTNINFNEVAFPTSDSTFSSPQSYNVLDDVTGAELTTLNGDLDDITVTTSSIGGGSFDYRTASSGSFRLKHGFNGSVSSNNPGTRVENQLQLDFASHLNITDLAFDVTSANSSGVAWEVTIFQLLDENGAVFSPAPTIDPYLSHTEINGSFSLGTYVLDSKATVTGVGTDLTSAGASNPNENFTATGDLEYSDFGLPAGTKVSGIRMTTILEDTRGITNSNTNFSSSLIDITISGDIVPEPSSALLSALSTIFLLSRRKRVN